METKRRQRAAISFNFNGRQVGSIGTFNDSEDYQKLQARFNFHGNFPTVFIEENDIKFTESLTGTSLRI